MSELATRRPQSVAEHAVVDYEKALQYLGLNPASPQAHALVLVCQRYDLDPLLGHVSLYDGKPYVHFAAYLHIANNRPEFQGIECMREWEDETYHWATVRVHRADRSFPSERTGKSRKVKRKKDGSKYEDDQADAKAFAQACRRALRMAFNVDSPEPAEDEEVAAPAPVVEIARKMSDPPTQTNASDARMNEALRQSDPPEHLAPPVPGGSDPTSEGEDARRASRAGDSRSPELTSPSDPMSGAVPVDEAADAAAVEGRTAAPDPTSPAPGRESQGPGTPTSEGRGPDGAESSRPTLRLPSDPTSPPYPAGAQKAAAAERGDAKVGPAGPASPAVAPTLAEQADQGHPVVAWCEDHDVDIRQARIYLRKSFPAWFTDLRDWRDLAELDQERVPRALAYLSAQFDQPEGEQP